jgi:hypothetical protein
MKKLIVISLLALSSSLFAQYVRPNEGGGTTTPGNTTNPALQSGGFGDNLSIGGSFGLYFGSTTYVGLEPLLSYHFNKSLMVGAGPIYQYVSEDYGNGYGTYSSSTYGARIATMFFLPEDLSRVFLMGEYDVLNVPEQNQYTGQLYRGTLLMPMLGLGYKDQITDKLFFCIYGLWNFNTSYYNPFTNPIINAGFDLGLWQ